MKFFVNCNFSKILSDFPKALFFCYILNFRIHLGIFAMLISCNCFMINNNINNCDILEFSQKYLFRLTSFELHNRYLYFSISAKSSSTLPIGFMLYFSTRTFSTFGLMNAGRLGPRRIFCIPRCSRVSSIATAFCSYQDTTSESGKSFTPQLNASARAVAILMAE